MPRVRLSASHRDEPGRLDAGHDLLCRGRSRDAVARGDRGAGDGDAAVRGPSLPVGPQESHRRRRRSSLAFGALLLGVVAARARSASDPPRSWSDSAPRRSARTPDLQLWRDSWRVIHAHPLGIGRGAFDRVYPIYRTLHTATTTRFAFVENQPLQMLIDGGWVFLVAIVVGFGALIAHVARRGRRDVTESALIAGLVAVLVHSCLDFGLETLGVLLPFMVVLGTLLGRMRSPPARNAQVQVADHRVRRRQPRHRHRVGRARQLRRLRSTAEARDANPRRSATCWCARSASIPSTTSMRWPTRDWSRSSRRRAGPRRDSMLSIGPSRSVLRAMSIHVEVARNLWSLGLRRQALLEWRSAVDIQPKLLAPASGRAVRGGRETGGAGVDRSRRRPSA